MEISNKGLNIIKEFEGYRSTAYQCAAGVWTIGWGTTKYPNGNSVKSGDTCTESQATNYLKHDIEIYVNAVNTYLDTDSKYVNQNIFDALVSFSYNLGANILNESTGNNQIASLTNKGNYTEATRQMKLFNKAGGVVNQGLVNRREKEVELYLTEVEEPYWTYAEEIETIKVRYGDRRLIKFTGTCGIFRNQAFTEKSKVEPFQAGQMQMATPIGWDGKYYKYSFISSNGETFYFRTKTKKNY